MIKVRFVVAEEGKISGFSVEGHSDFAEHGKDIVCAGVSSLALTALLGIEKHLHREMDYDIASGKLCMKLKGAPDDLTEAILKTMLLGIERIADQYPKDVRILDK